jgi:hypothetical protein
MNDVIITEMFAIFMCVGWGSVETANYGYRYQADSSPFPARFAFREDELYTLLNEDRSYSICLVNYDLMRYLYRKSRTWGLVLFPPDIRVECAIRFIHAPSGDHIPSLKKFLETLEPNSSKFMTELANAKVIDYSAIGYLFPELILWHIQYNLYGSSELKKKAKYPPSGAIIRCELDRSGRYVEGRCAYYFLTYGVANWLLDIIREMFCSTTDEVNSSSRTKRSVAQSFSI